MTGMDSLKYPNIELSEYSEKISKQSNIGILKLIQFQGLFLFRFRALSRQFRKQLRKVQDRHQTTEPNGKYPNIRNITNKTFLHTNCRFMILAPGFIQSDSARNRKI